MRRKKKPQYRVLRQNDSRPSLELQRLFLTLPPELQEHVITSILSLVEAVDVVQGKLELSDILGKKTRQAKLVALHKALPAPKANKKERLTPKAVWPAGLPDRDALLRLFKYDAGLGRLLWLCGPSRSDFAGKIGSRGYRWVTINKHKYLESHIIWLLHHDQIVGRLTHKRADKLDTHLRNLQDER